VPVLDPSLAPLGTDDEAVGAPSPLVGFGADGTTIEIEVYARIPTTATADFLEAQETLILDIVRSVEACRIEVTHPPPADRV
jgi:hypothetical protein